MKIYRSRLSSILAYATIYIIFIFCFHCNAAQLIEPSNAIVNITSNGNSVSIDISDFVWVVNSAFDYAKKQAAPWGIALFILFFRQIRNLFRRLTPVEYFIGRTSDVNIVLPSIRGVQFFAKNLNKVLTVPPNAALMPLGDAFGFIEISNFLRSLPGRKFGIGGYNITPHFGSNLPISPELNFIAIGGHSVNIVTYRNLTQYGLSNIKFDVDCCTIDDVSYITERDGTDSNAEITVDYGFIINISTVENGDRRILLLFGNWPQGTLSASKAVIGKTSSKWNYKELRMKSKSKADFIAVVKCTTSELLDNHIEIVSIKDTCRAGASSDRIEQ